MISLKLLISSRYWKNNFSWEKILQDCFIALGGIWLIIQLITFFTNSIEPSLKKDWVAVLTITIIWILYKNWPKTVYSFRLKSKDITIQLSIGNMFDYDGDFVIPINTSFDTSFESDLISKKSVQGQFTTRYYSESAFLDRDIQYELNNDPPIDLLPEKKKGNKYRYEMGKVVKVKLALFDRFAYLLAISDMSNDGTASTNFDNVLTSLGSLWEFIRTKGECGSVNMPIVGTGRGRVLESRQVIIKAIVHSFVDSAITTNRFCNKLNIVIHQSDFKNNEIDLKDLTDYIRLRTIHY